MAVPTRTTKAVLPSAFVQEMHVPAPWADYRVRVLSEAGLLPRRREPLTFEHLAAGLCGLFASDTHLEAAERSRQTFDLPFVAVVKGEGLLFGDLAGLTYGQALAAMLHQCCRPNTPVALQGITVCSTHPEADLLLAGQTSPDPASYTEEAYRYAVPGQALASHVFRLKTKHEVGGSVLRALALLGSNPDSLFSGNTAPPSASVEAQDGNKTPRNENGDTLPGVSPFHTRPRENAREIRTSETQDISGHACVYQALTQSRGGQLRRSGPYARRLETAASDVP